jgi:hypothetical protein
MIEVQNKSAAERRVMKEIVGQNAGVREINFSDPTDVSRIEEINRAPNVERHLGVNMVSSDLLFALAKTGVATVYGVAGSERVSPDEKGELQGWIYTCKDRSPATQQLIRTALQIPSSQKTGEVYSVTYAKLPAAPEGQMSSALRAACVDLAHKESQRRQIYPDQIDRPESYMPRAHVVAYVRPDNIDSQMMLEAAGFVRRGIRTPSTSNEESTYMYVLDWNELNKKLQEVTDAQVISSGTRQENTPDTLASHAKAA